MHVGQACAHGPTDTTDCATAVDRSDESEPTTWKLIHFVIELFKELRRPDAGEISEPSAPRDPLQLAFRELHEARVLNQHLVGAGLAWQRTSDLRLNTHGQETVMVNRRPWRPSLLPCLPGGSPDSPVPPSSESAFWLLAVLASDLPADVS